MKKTIFTIVMGLFYFLCNAQQISFERMEPPYWFDGFHEKTFLILVYGKNISQADVSGVGDGIRLNKVITLDSPDYIILEMVFTSDPMPGNFPITFSKDKKVLTEYLYEIKSGPATPERKPISEPFYISASPAGLYNIDPVYQAGDQYLFLADTLHKQGKQLFFSTELTIGSGNPLAGNPPVAKWITATKTSRSTINTLKIAPLLDTYLVQHCLFWITILHADGLCVRGSSENDKKYYELVKARVEKEFPGFPVTNDCSKK